MWLFKLTTLAQPLPLLKALTNSQSKRRKKKKTKKKLSKMHKPLLKVDDLYDEAIVDDYKQLFTKAQPFESPHA
jgi:hypothetical protein